MQLPYQCVAALGQTGIVAAARGTSIFTFGADGSVLSSWEHPATQRKTEPVSSITEGDVDAAAKVDEVEGSSPTKRRKVETDVGVQAVAADAQEEQASTEGDAKTTDQNKTKRGRRSTKPSDYKGQEQPHVIILRTTSDGSHLVAVTGTDKAVWVFEHDGQGQLKELSQRSMPKRPCDLALTSDNNTILVADKFGDVYSLPLIPSTNTEGTETPKARLVPEAKGPNSLTVHTQRNLNALKDQEHQRQNNPQPKTKEAPTFVHDLLIGHVSMLTCVTVAEDAEGRPYIITADRDEHIRVSRGIPQSYVIENFCLGHESFVNALCFAQKDVLVSGGGDNELYFWKWQSGLLQGKAELLGHAQKIVPDASKVAVTKLVSSDEGFIFAICERVPAVFVFRYTNGEGLTFTQTIPLAGNALDISIVSGLKDSRARLVVGVDDEKDADSADPQIAVFELNREHWETAAIQFQTTDIRGLEVTRADLDKLLYTAEVLRKSDNPYADEEGDTLAPDSEAPPTPV